MNTGSEFDSDDDAEKIFGKVKTGTLKTTSVRYAVDAWEEVKAGAVSADGRFTGPCPELDNRIGYLRLPTLERYREEPVLVTLPQNYAGKTLTVAQSSDPSGGELQEPVMTV